jgi:hypothetical protein
MISDEFSRFLGIKIIFVIRSLQDSALSDILLLVYNISLLVFLLGFSPTVLLGFRVRMVTFLTFCCDFVFKWYARVICWSSICRNLSIATSSLYSAYF